jgi:PAS domain S-box-containing protein
MRYRFEELVDLDEFRALMQGFYETTGIIYGLVDSEGRVLGNAGWRRICTYYHRAHPEAERRCRDSNLEMFAMLREGEPVGRLCQHGLMDYGVPVIIDGQHVATMATGQLFHEPPDEERFRAQAREFGFDEEEYLQAVREVPVITKEQVLSVMRFYSQLAHILANNGLLRLRQLEAEAALAAEKERLTVTLRSIGDGVIATDAEGRVSLLNNIAEHLTGWRQEDALGRPLTEVFVTIHEETRRPTANPAEMVLRTGRTVGMANHTLLVARDGTEYMIADSGAPILDAEKRVLGVVLVFRDITVESRLQADLQLAAKLDSIGVLAGGIAHDFNNMLAAIAGNISLATLMVDTRQLERAQGYLSEAENASIRARDLTQQLLTFARGGSPVKSSVAVDALVQEAARFALAGSHNRCEFHLGVLWLVDADPGQLTQVIQNLVLNADQAMPNGGVIRIEADNVLLPEDSDLPLPGGPYVRIAVIDQGVGMASDLMERIFDPFFTTKQRGSGLGLTSAYSIVKSHQGHIAVTSTMGRGSTFTLYLPANPEAAAEHELELLAATAVGARGILVMDDEDAVREMLAAMLRELGHEVTAVASGEDAIAWYTAALAAGTPPDLVILDLTIPGGIGGHEVLARLCQLDPAVRAIATSGYSLDPVLAHCIDCGFQAGLCKPFRMSELQRVLAEVLAATERREAF